MTTELKDILPNHFEKIGFDVKDFTEKYFENILERGKTYTDNYISNSIEIWLGKIRFTIDYATILTSKEYIDCLAEYVEKKYLIKDYDDNNESPSLYIDDAFIIMLPEIMRETVCGEEIADNILVDKSKYEYLKDLLSASIGVMITRLTIADFINNITKDENI